MNEFMIEADGLMKRYGTTVALAGVGLQVPTGSVLGVVGPHGAGKTTTVRILTALTAPDAGWARVAGRDVVHDPTGVQAKIGVPAQDAAVNQMLTGRQNLVMTSRLSGLLRPAAQRMAEDLLERFELTDAGDEIVVGYTNGTRRLLGLAAGLVMHPQVLFLDEPTAGLDPVDRVQMWRVLRALVAEGATLLMTTADLAEANELADRIIVLENGQAIAAGTPTQLNTRAGGAVLQVTLTSAHPDAAAAVGRIAAGEVAVSRDGLHLRADVDSGSGLASAVVRTLDSVGISVDDVEVSPQSLDDLFFALTGHAAGVHDTTGEDIALDPGPGAGRSVQPSVLAATG